MTTAADWHQQGRLLQQQRRLQEAELAYNEALRLAPDRLVTLNNLAILKRDQKNFQQSQVLLWRGLRRAQQQWQTGQDQQQLCINWARLLHSSAQLALEQGDIALALKLNQHALQLAPEGSGYVNYGVSLDAVGRNAEAERSHLLGLQRHKLTGKPEDWIGRDLGEPQHSSQVQTELSNLATSRLRQQPLLWQHWELLLSRLGKDPSIWLQSPLPWSQLWRGEWVAELVVWDEQGFGDALQCLRWIGMACEKADQVTLMLRASLLRLVHQRLKLPSNCRLEILNDHQAPLQTGHRHCPLMGLPVALYQRHAAINPWPAPSQVQPMLTSITSANLGAAKRIGLVWQAGSKAEADAQRSSEMRSLPCALLINHALAWCKGGQAELISLQLGEPQQEIQPWIQQGLVSQLSDCQDWEDTASFVEQLDLVVSVDTAMVHLAGNLGVPCVVLLNAVHDWRWGLATEPMHWYHKQTLLRCSKLNAWDEVLYKADLVVNGLLRT